VFSYERLLVPGSKILECLVRSKLLGVDVTARFLAHKAIVRLTEFVEAECRAQGRKCVAAHLGAVVTEFSKTGPPVVWSASHRHHRLLDTL
jgi:hypothetical protein